MNTNDDELTGRERKTMSRESEGTIIFLLTIIALQLGVISILIAFA